MATDLKAQIIIDAVTKGGDGILQLGESVRKLSDEAGKAAPEFDALSDELKRLVSQFAAVETFERAASDMQKATDALDDLGRQTAEAQRALADAEKQFGTHSEQARQARERINELGESTTKYKEQLLQYGEQLDKARGGLERAGVSSKAFGSAQEQLGTQVDRSRGALEHLASSAQQTAQIMSDRNLLGVRAHADVQKEIEATRAAYERLKTSGQLTGKELAQAAMKADERIRELKSSTNGWLESLGKAKVALASMGAAFGGIGVAVKHAIDFESAMSDVAKVVDGTDEQMASLARRIREMGGEIPIAAEGLAAIAAAGGQMGVPIEKLETFVQLAAKMGTAFGMSAEQAGDAVAKLANVFSLPIEQVENLGDAINVLGNTMAAKESDIVEVLKRIGGSAKQFGLTAEQAAALGASMLALGVRAEVAGTGINAILTKLQTASMQGKEFQAALESMGVSAEQLARDIEANPQQALEQFLKTLSKLEGSARAETLTKLFGIEYQDDVARLIGSLETYEGALGRIGDATQTAGAMQAEFDKKNETVAAQLERLGNVFDDIATNIGEAFLPSLKVAVAVTGEVAKAVAALTSEFPNLTAAVTTAVVGRTSLGAMKTVVLALNTAMPALGATIAKVAASTVGLQAAIKGVLTPLMAIGGVAAPVAAVAAGIAYLTVKIVEFCKAAKEIERLNQLAAEAQERLAESTERLRQKFEDIAKSTGVSVRSMEELDAAVKDGRIIFDEATATWISAAQAQEKLAQSSDAAADSTEKLAKKAKESADSIVATFQKTAEGGTKLGEALKELSGSLDMKAGVEGVAAFALALDGLSEKNKYLTEDTLLTSAQIGEAWKQAIEGMNAGQVGALIEQLRQAGEQGVLTAEQMSAALDGVLGASLENLGVQVEGVWGGISEGAQSVLESLDTVASGMELAGMRAEQVQVTMEKAFEAAMPKMDTLDGIKALQERMEGARATGQLSEEAFQRLSRQLDGMKDKALESSKAMRQLAAENERTLSAARGELRITETRLNAQKALARQSEELARLAGDEAMALHYKIEQLNIDIQLTLERAKVQRLEQELIIQTNNARLDELRAKGLLTKAKEEEIKAANRLAQARIQEAEAMKQSVRIMEQAKENLRNYGNEQGRAAEQSRRATSNAAEGWRDVAAEANNARNAVDGYSSSVRNAPPPPSSGGRRPTVQGKVRHTWKSLYEYALQAGADEAFARELADKTFDEQGRWKATLFNEMRRHKLDFFSDEVAVQRAIERKMRFEKPINTGKKDAPKDAQKDDAAAGWAQGRTPGHDPAREAGAGRTVSYVSNITLPSGKRSQVRTTDADSQSALKQMLEELSAAKSRAM